MTCYTALITPFDDEGRLDEGGFQNNLLHQKCVDGLVVLGTTGEEPTLSFEEKKRLICLAKSTSLPLMVGCGGYSTSQTIENLKFVADLGADRALVVTPYYNKPTQEGLFSHFEKAAIHSPIPIIIYNIQRRTAVNLAPDTLERLLDFPQIQGVKEASGDMNQITEVISLKEKRPDFLVYSGDDILTLPLMAVGGDGVISVTSNLFPHLMKKLVSCCHLEDYKRARALNARLLPFFYASTLQTNPIPIKAAMNFAGFAAGLPRLPLTPLHPSHLPSLKKAVETLL